MARIYTQKTRKERTCGRCGQTISPGETYRQASPGFRSRPLIRCAKVECSFRQSELTASKMSGAYAALEDAEDALLGELQTVDEVRDVLQTAADGLREVAEEYREASQSWGNGQGNDEWDMWADELDSAADELEGWEPDDPEDEEIEGQPDEDKVAEWVQSASDLLSNVSLP